FVDRLIGHLECRMSVGEICQEYDLTLEQVMAVKRLSLEQVQYCEGLCRTFGEDCLIDGWGYTPERRDRGVGEDALIQQGRISREIEPCLSPLYARKRKHGHNGKQHCALGCHPRFQ